MLSQSPIVGKLSMLSPKMRIYFNETIYYWRLGSRRLSDRRERPRRGITPDPLPDGESEEVKEGEHPPGIF